MIAWKNYNYEPQDCDMLHISTKYEVNNADLVYVLKEVEGRYDFALLDENGVEVNRYTRYAIKDIINEYGGILSDIGRIVEIERRN